MLSYAVVMTLIVSAIIIVGDAIYLLNQVDRQVQVLYNALTLNKRDNLSLKLVVDK